MRGSDHRRPESGRRVGAIVVLALAVAALASCGGGDPPIEDGSSIAGPHRTEDGRFQVTVTPELDPVPINRIHTWVITVTDPDGRPLDGARVVLDGDMPEHQHGLPTVPRMTGSTGPGAYRIEGVKFSMPGYWVMTLHVWWQGVTDRVTLELTLG